MRRSKHIALGGAVAAAMLIISSPAFAAQEWGSRGSNDQVSVWIGKVTTNQFHSESSSSPSSSQPSPPPKVGLLRCLEVSWAVGDPLVPECETYFWLPGPNGPELMANPSPGAPEPGAAMPVPTPAEIIEYAVATVTAGGSGLTVQPDGNALVGIPSLVHAATPTQTLETSLFGTRVVVSLEATGFSYDFGDGTAPLVTSDPSAPYPVTRLAHTYAAEQEGVVVVLTTRWAGTVTSPFTGETATVDGVVTTSESSAPFDVRRARIDLVAD